MGDGMEGVSELGEGENYLNSLFCLVHHSCGC